MLTGLLDVEVTTCQLLVTTSGSLLKDFTLVEKRCFSLLSWPSFIAQWLEHLHGKWKILDSIPGLGTPFSPEYDCSLHQEESLIRLWTIGEENI